MLTYGIPPEFRGGVHLFILNRHMPSGQSRVYRVTQFRIDGVHCRESAGTGPENLKVVPNWAGHHHLPSFFFVIPFPLDVGLHLSVNMWTHQPGSHRRKITQDFSSTFLLRSLPYFFVARRIQPPLPFPRRP